MENQMEKKMENEMETLGPFKGVYKDITPIMENQMEKDLYKHRALRAVTHLVSRLPRHIVLCHLTSSSAEW